MAHKGLGQALPPVVVAPRWADCPARKKDALLLAGDTEEVGAPAKGLSNAGTHHDYETSVLIRGRNNQRFTKLHPFGDP